MAKTILINAVEANAAQPRKTEYIHSFPDALRAWVEEMSAEKTVFVVGKSTPKTGQVLSSMGYDILTIDDSFALVCQDPSAIAKAYYGEKPIPDLHEDTEALAVINLLQQLPEQNLLQTALGDERGGCAVDTLERLVNVFRQQSCGKCVFCREGLGQMSSILADFAAGCGKDNDEETLLELAELLAEHTLCSFGKEAGDTILLFLRENQEEFHRHLKDKICPSATCAGLSFYKILGAQCIGCGDCMDACSEDAISGKARFIHVIEEKYCNRCGKCLDECKADAIIRCNAENKPTCPVRPMPVGSWKR